MAYAEAEDVRLAAALLDDVPQALASPGAWRQLFFAQHADAAVFAGLFTACTAGRDCAVRTAPSMTVKLKLQKYRCKDDIDALRQAWLRKANVVQGALTTRGALPTKLLVVLLNGGWEDADDIALFQALHGKHVTALHVRPKQYGLSDKARKQASRLLHLATSAFKHSLVTLYLNIDLPFPRELTPKHLPHLRSLVIKTHWYQSDNSFKPGFAYVNIHPFLPQLTSLRGDIRKSYEIQHRGYSPCQELFWRHNTRTRSLTKFTTNDPIDSVDLRLLLDCAPNLSYLGSPSADDIANFSKESWPVGELGKECTLSTLLRLPGQRAGKLRMTGGWLVLIVEAEVSISQAHTHALRSAIGTVLSVEAEVRIGTRSYAYLGFPNATCMEVREGYTTCSSQGQGLHECIHHKQ